METSASTKYRHIPSTRLSVSVMFCAIMFAMTLMRVNISIAVVCMVKSTSLNDAVVTDNVNFSNFNSSMSAATQSGNDIVNYTEVDNVTSSHSRYEGEFAWNKKLQGFVLSSYFLGFIATQVLGGWLSGRYGGKHVGGIGLLVSVAATVVQPAGARISPYLLICLRILLGAANGVIPPNVQCLLGQWAPPLERTFLTNVAFMGTTLGSIAVLLFSSQLCELPVDNGWPFAFYITGAIGFVVWICWNFIVYSSPTEHPRISRQELEYIARCSGSKKESQNRRAFPWLKALTSPAVLAAVFSQTTVAWLFYTNIMTLPMYMKDVLKFDIKQNGFYLMLPHLVVVFVNPLTSQLFDAIRRREILSTATVRKVCQGISNFSSALLCILVTFVDHDTRYLAVVIFIAMQVAVASCRSGVVVNPQDIAPRYSGELYGIQNTAATLAGIIAPMTCSFLTPNGSAVEWKTVFYIAAGILTIGGVVFCVFAKGEVLPWAKDEEDDQVKSPSCGKTDFVSPDNDSELDKLRKNEALDNNN